MNELMDIAIFAFRNAHYRDAIELLLQAAEIDPNNWIAALYLAMAYQESERISDAHRVFKRIAICCPDDHIRVKAQSVMPLLDAELCRRFKKEPLPGRQQIPSNSNDSVTSLA